MGVGRHKSTGLKTGHYKGEERAGQGRAPTKGIWRAYGAGEKGKLEAMRGPLTGREVRATNRFGENDEDGHTNVAASPLDLPAFQVLLQLTGKPLFCLGVYDGVRKTDEGSTNFLVHDQCLLLSIPIFVGPIHFEQQNDE